jgi:hypothetical protein
MDFRRTGSETGIPFRRIRKIATSSAVSVSPSTSRMHRNIHEKNRVVLSIEIHHAT